MRTVGFTAMIGKLNYMQSAHYVEITSTVMKKLKEMAKQRLVCRLNDSLEYSCGILSLGEGRGFITLNKSRMQQLQVQPGDRVRVELRVDDSPYGLPMPEELEEVLHQDPEGHERFHQLTGGKQRNIILWVGAYKNSQRRIDRALEVINRLKTIPEGKETLRRIFGMD